MSQLHKFLFDGLPVRGMLVQLTDVWQEVLKRRAANAETGAYPEAVRHLLGEMTAASVLMQSNIKFNGALVMQIFGDGPLKLAVVEVQPDLSLRATAKVVGELGDASTLPEMVNVNNEGKCAITLDPLNKMPGQQPYQGVVPLFDDQRNKLAIAKNELLNTSRDYKGVDAEYRDKVSKAESDKYATLSAMYDAEAQVTKLQNQYNNYDRRTGFYYLIAPQDGFVSRATKSGIGETVKEGEEVVRITPNKFDQAVEIYIDPVNTPLVHVGENVRLIFDGWPAFVISGWSQMSTGLFDGQIVGIDPVIQQNGQLRIWVKPNAVNQWPDQLRQGGGVRAFMLLNDVPLGYELWRLLNAFPPDYYQGKEKGAEKADQGKEAKKEEVKEEKE